MNNGFRGFEWEESVTTVKKKKEKKKKKKNIKLFRVIVMTEDGRLIQDTDSENGQMKKQTNNVS